MQEEPCGRSQKTQISAVFSHIHAPCHKCRKEVSSVISEVFPDISRQFFIHGRLAEVRRISDNNCIFLPEKLTNNCCLFTAIRKVIFTVERAYRFTYTCKVIHLRQGICSEFLSFYAYRRLCGSSCTFVEFKSEKVVFQSISRSNFCIISKCNILLKKNIECVQQHIAAAHAGINELYLFKGELFPIFQLGRKTQFSAIYGMTVLRKIPPESVIHHVPHHPVGGEDLRRRCDFLGAEPLALFKSHSYLISIGLIVVLVTPAQHIIFRINFLRQRQKLRSCSAVS